MPPSRKSAGVAIVSKAPLLFWSCVESQPRLDRLKAKPRPVRVNKPIEAGKLYKVAGWAPVAEGLKGEPIWEVVTRYLRDRKTIAAPKLNLPKLVGVAGNPGIS